MMTMKKSKHEACPYLKSEENRSQGTSYSVCVRGKQKCHRPDWKCPIKEG